MHIKFSIPGIEPILEKINFKPYTFYQEERLTYIKLQTQNLDRI